eukprot:scaffold2652_cov120-Skeletonema_dohrnii-CCMP3373.AAC.2
MWQRATYREFLVIKSSFSFSQERWIEVIAASSGTSMIHTYHSQPWYCSPWLSAQRTKLSRIRV